MQPRIYLCWIPQAARSWIHPVRTLDLMIEQANAAEGDSRANSVRLNWMVDDLRHNPLHKPILVDAGWRVVVGDTRIMAADLLGWTTVPVLAQLHEPVGHVIADQNALIRWLGLSKSAQIQHRPMDVDLYSEPVTWFDIDIGNTKHHMHAEDQRQRQIDRYLAEQHPGFQFTQEWYRQPINWTRY